MESERDFYAGIVCALDVVASMGEGTVFKEIAQTCDVKELGKEVMENGQPYTKEMWKAELSPDGTKSEGK